MTMALHCVHISVDKLQCYETDDMLASHLALMVVMN